MPRKQTPRKGAAHQPTPSPKKKSATKATPSPKGPPVHANVKTMTRLFRDHIAALRRWIETEDEGRDVLTSLERFTGRIPLLERARWDERKLGALQGRHDGIAAALVCEHSRETQRLAAHLRNTTLPELGRALDDMQKRVEDGVALLARDGWDPAAPAGACPAAPLELLTWMDQLNDMFVDELWRKEVLAENVLRAVWTEVDEDAAAATARDGARLWPRGSPESFVDVDFLEIVLTNHDYVLL